MRLVWLLAGGLGLAAAYVDQMLRWLRVLQREHYEAAAPARFWRRWTFPSLRYARVATLRRYRPISLGYVLCCALPVVVIVAVFASLAAPLVVVTIAYGLCCPWGLGPRGRTSDLQWTRRLRTVAVAALVISAAVSLAAVVAGEGLVVGALMVWAVPFTLGLAAAALEPYENRLAGRFVDQARQRLARVHPLVVAITGSYGKTSTKNHLADLLRGDGGVVATPKSFNNRAGLSRSINENLADGTRVFIAEMGTYGPGEIAALCAWCPPEIAVITAIGPVHLERMGSLDVIERAKFEITEQARVVIVNADDPRLATWPSRLGERRVRTAGSANPTADVRVTPTEGLWRVWVDGLNVAEVPAVAGLQPTNVACALAAALELGATTDELARRLGALAPVANRATVATATSGVVLIDDTFNANPASARASLDLLDSLGVAGRRVVVTPGLIELGDEQAAANEELGREVARRGAQLVVVGRTNAAALMVGYGPEAQHLRLRDEAVAWVRSSLVAGDGVLYLNDLPDHYP